MAIQPPHGHLSERSPRYADWMRVFGSGMVELENPVGEYAILPGLGRQRSYKLKVSSLTVEQRERLIAWMAEKWNVPASQVAADLDGPHGCPILADDVMVSFDSRLIAPDADFDDDDELDEDDDCSSEDEA